jgi:hypothetical protein
MKETYILLACGMLGVAIHTLMKAQSLKTDMEKANLEFVFSKYWQKDILGIAVSFLSVFVWLFLQPEVSAKYIGLQNWIRASYFAMGMMGSYVIQLLLSGSKRWLRKQIDVKTDKADLK